MSKREPTRVVAVRFTHGQYAEIAEAATAEGKTVSAFVRRAVANQGAGRHRRPPFAAYVGTPPTGTAGGSVVYMDNPYGTAQTA